MLTRGIIELTEKLSVKNFVADPNGLLLFFEKEKTEIDKRKKIIEEKMDYLNSLRQNKSVPLIRIFEGDDGFKKMFSLILEYYQKNNDKIFRAFGINKINDISINDFVRSFIEKRSILGVKTQLMIPEGDDDFDITGQDKTLGREIKKIKIKEQKAGVYIAGDHLFFFSYDDKIGVMIKNTSISNLIRDYFDMNWGKK